jgi:hypothetical protein
MRYMQGLARLSVVAGMVLGAGCATTVFDYTWKAPGVKPFSMQGGRVVALVMARDFATRRSAEDALARELTARGLKGIPAYTLVPDIQDEAKAKAALEAAGAVGVVAMRPVAKEEELVATTAPPPIYYGAPRYGGFWGGYWGYGWGGAWGVTEVRTNTVVTIETLIYSLTDNSLLWAGQSRTTNPGKVDAFVREIVAAAVKELKKQGLL